MNLNYRFFASILLGLCLLTACGDSGTSVSADDAPVASSSNGVSWSALSEEQRSILSMLESAWPEIPADDQQELAEKAGRWTRMQPREQAEFRETWNQYRDSENN